MGNIQFVSLIEYEESISICNNNPFHITRIHIIWIPIHYIFIHVNTKYVCDALKNSTPDVTRGVRQQKMY